jgi:hypothetical protein
MCIWFSNFFEKRICQPREPAHLHAHREVMPFGVGRAHVLRIAVAFDPLLMDSDALCRAAAALEGAGGRAVQLHQMRVIHVATKLALDCLGGGLIAPFFQRAVAAVRAASDRTSGGRARVRALPPLARLGARLGVSSISPVAIRMTWTALPIASEWRFSPLGPRSMGQASPTPPTVPRPVHLATARKFKLRHYPRRRDSRLQTITAIFPEPKCPRFRGFWNVAA